VSSLIETIGPSKHHMLEHVSETLSIWFLILGANVIPNLDSDNRAGEVLEGQDLQTVIENDLLVRKGFFLRSKPGG